MSSERRSSHDRYNPWPITCTVLGALAFCLLGNSLNGNEHGASKTNLDPKPNFSVEPMPVQTTSAPNVPPVAKTTSMWVCARIVVDRQRGEVIVNPVVEAQNTGRPLYLAGVTAAGAQFNGDLPRDNFSVFKLDGGEDNDNQLSPDECKKTDVVPRAVDGPEPFILVESGSGLQSGADVAAGPEGALRVDQVHGQFNGLTDQRIDKFLNSLPAY